MANTYARTEASGSVLHTWTFDVDGNGAWAQWDGGPAMISTDKSGAIGGGTIVFEWSPDGGTTMSSIGATITSPGAVLQHLPTLASGHVRAVMAGSTSPALNAYLK